MITTTETTTIDLETESAIGQKYALSIAKVVIKYAQQNVVKNCNDILKEALDI